MAAHGGFPGTTSGVHGSRWDQIRTLFAHALLPLIAYAIGDFAILTMTMKNSLMENLSADYVRTAVAKGVAVSQGGHRPRHAQQPDPHREPPGVRAHRLLRRLLLIETIFNIDGIGLLGYEAIVERDYPTVMGILAITSMLMLVGNIVSDICCVALVDPVSDLETEHESDLFSCRCHALSSPISALHLLWIPRAVWRITMQLNPVTLKTQALQVHQARLLLLCHLLGLGDHLLLAELLVNSRALAVSYQGSSLPTYGDVIPGQHFGPRLRVRDQLPPTASQAGARGQGETGCCCPWCPGTPMSRTSRRRPIRPMRLAWRERHFLGTDTSGRDVLARLVYGFRIAIGFAFIALVASYVIGVSIGCMMGFLGGRFDLILQRFIEIWSQVPFLYVIMRSWSPWPS